MRMRTDFLSGKRSKQFENRKEGVGWIGRCTWLGAIGITMSGSDASCFVEPRKVDPIGPTSYRHPKDA